MPRTTIRTEDITVDPYNADNLSSGSVPTGRLGNVPPNTGLQNDIATLALHSAIADNKAAFNLTNAFIDQFEDDSGIDVETTVVRNSNEYMIAAVNEKTSADQTIMDGSGYSASVVDAASSGTYLYGSNNWTMIDDSVDTMYDGHYNNQNVRLQKTWPTMLSDGSGSVNNQTSGYLNFGSYFGTSSADIFYAVDAGLANYLNFTITRFIGVRGYASGTYDFNLYGTNALVSGGSTWTLLANIETSLDATADQDSGVFTNTTKYRYYRFAAQDFASSQDFVLTKLRFYGDIYADVVNATGNYTSTSQTANATVSKMGIILLYKNAYGAATLDTDLVAQVSSDGGSNYTSAPLTAGGTFSSGILVAKSNDVTISNTGTAPKYKISFANQSASSKETQVHGVALIY